MQEATPYDVKSNYLLPVPPVTQATMPFRVERVMRKQNVSEDEARQIIKKIDEMRENYVTKYAGISRYDTRNYDLVITADGKSEDQIVDIIMQVIG